MFAHRSLVIAAHTALSLALLCTSCTVCPNPAYEAPYTATSVEVDSNKHSIQVPLPGTDPLDPLSGKAVTIRLRPSGESSASGTKGGTTDVTNATGDSSQADPGADVSNTKSDESAAPSVTESGKGTAMPATVDAGSESSTSGNDAAGTSKGDKIGLEVYTENEKIPADVDAVPVEEQKPDRPTEINTRSAVELATEQEPDDIGAIAGISVSVVQQNLSNPTGIAHSPEGKLAYLDSARGAAWVPEIRDGVPYVSNFRRRIGSDESRTEHVQGPLSILWLDETRLVITDAGQDRGKETVSVYRDLGMAFDGDSSNSVEGATGLTGLSKASNNKDVYLVARTSRDAKILKYDVNSETLEEIFNSSDNGIDATQPTQTLVVGDDKLLVLYAGSNGEMDSKIVRWNLNTRSLERVWYLKNVYDALAFAKIPGSDSRFVIADNPGTVDGIAKGSIVTIALDDNTASITPTIIANRVLGPSSMSFDKDGDLLVAQTGHRANDIEGSLIKLSGVK